MKKKSPVEVCHYHLCRKKEKLFQCGWCGQFFCRKHLDPKPAGIPDFGAHSKSWKFTEEGRKTNRFMEEWHKMDGHPCPPYTSHWERQIKDSHDEEGRAFDRLLKPGTVAKNADENSCHYHLCRKITELHECKYCKEYFCKEHLVANPPGGTHHYVEGHPCPHHDEVAEERGQALDKLLGPKPLWFPKLEKEEPIHPEEETYNSHSPLHRKKIGPYKNVDRTDTFQLPLIVFLMGLIILFFGMAAVSFSTIPEKQVKKEIASYSNKTVSYSVPVDISFKEYLSITDKNYNANVTLIGRLREEIDTRSYVNQYVVDYYGSKIKLYLIGAAYEEYDKLFIENSTTKSLYRVSGILRTTRTWDSELNIEVQSIEPAQKPTTEVSKVIEEKKMSYYNETIKSSFNLSYGFNKFKVFLFGCKPDERKYNFECIPIVKCSDGTLEPDCSTNKPLQCLNGTLINNAQKCGCSKDSIENGTGCRSILCSDGTREPECSSNKPYTCEINQLIPNSAKCGCPYDYRKDGNNCKKIQRCSDETIYDECAQAKPMYCHEGTLVKNASICGCSGEDVPDGDVCVSKYMTASKDIKLNYILRGSKGEIAYAVYGGLNDYLKALPRSMSYTSGGTPPSSLDFIMRDLNNEKQNQFLGSLVSKIRDTTSNKDDQARIAISIVQNIPYDNLGLATGNINGKYPYEVLYTNTGVCSEKSQLLAYLLRGLGYGTVIFRYDTENHDAVGIKCLDYSYISSGYCFIESTVPSIITNSNGNYVGVGKLTSTPEILKISDGDSFNTVSEEYVDEQEYQKLIGMGTVLPIDSYHRWLALANKYGMPVN